MEKREQIVILDGYTLNPGDISWGEIEQLGHCAIYDRSTHTDIIQRLGSAEIALTNKTVLDAQTLSQLTTLKYIGVLATGYNVIDLEYTRKNNITVTNVPGYSGISVPQAVFALLFNFTNNVATYHATVRDGQWAKSKDFCYYSAPLTELSGKTMGIVGYGFIGKQTAEIAKAFGMNVLVHSRTTPVNQIDNVIHTSLEMLLKESDVISLHCPLTAANQQMINKSSLSLMKPNAILINTSRGPLINETDLAEALENKVIGGAALDVLSQEPPQPDNPLFHAPNCLLTPHISWGTKEARMRLMTIAANNISAFLHGTPTNTLSP